MGNLSEIACAGYLEACEFNNSIIAVARPAAPVADTVVNADNDFNKAQANIQDAIAIAQANGQKISYIS
ncbi:MAG: hypothetical protein J0M34_01195 [Alphaproteobacteria bacterium]|nr:hypothetical protein [Alphaproteobacteria bacterium]